MSTTTEAAGGRISVKGAETGQTRSSGPCLPGEEPGRKGRRGLQGTPAARRSRIRGVRLEFRVSEQTT
jgi:hypothetical protein